MNDLALTANGIGSIIGQRWIFRGLNIALARGESLALIGRSGSGKTTLLQTLGCMRKPAEGIVKINAQPMDWSNSRAMDDARARLIGISYQSPCLAPELSAQDNVCVSLRLSGFSRAEAANRALGTLAEMGIDAQAARRCPAELSGGQRQRVSLARSIAKTPSLLLLDEPTANLDERTAEEVMKLFFNALRARESSLIIATHDLRVASCCSRQLRIESEGPA